MADRKVGKRSMGRRGRSKMESGTCNVCSAPCSLCMHRSVGFTGSKSDESSDETCHEVAASQCSVNEDDVLRSSRVNAHSNSHTASEASNLVNTSHDAFSENAESKEIIRSSEVSDDSGAVEMSSKASSAEIGVKHKPHDIANVLDQSIKCVNGQEDSKADGQVNNLSSDYPNKRAGNKNSSDSSVLVSDPVLEGSNKNHDYVKIEPCNALPDESKLQSSDLKKGRSGAESNRDGENTMIEGSTHSSLDSKNEKLGEKTQSQKAEEPDSSPKSENESEDSEMVEHDVKVCDICGDAGREDLLAICSRCSDGAEHTYCMREMLDEVPEGDWLCEECKFAEEAEKQKLEAKRKREAEVNFNAHSSGKRHAEKAEAAPDAKRQAVEAPAGSPKKPVLPRIAALSREPSFKGLDKPKRKLVHQASFTNLSNDDAEITRATGSQLQSPKGTFFKSNSFNANSKPKVKLVDDVVLPRQRAVKEYSSFDMKEGVSRTIGKSMSIRSTEAGCSSGNDSKGKSVPSKFHHPQEVKGSKQLKEQNTEANSSASTGDQKFISRGNASLSHAKNTRELKGLQSESKLGGLTRQASSLNRHRLENPTTPVGESPVNEKGSSNEEISCQTNRKDEPPSISGSTEGLTSHASVSTPNAVPRSRESREMGEKSKEVVNRPRASLVSGSKGLESQKEGQTAEAIDTSCASDSDLSTTRNFRDNINKGNRLRAAVDAALRKKPSFGKNRGSEQPDGSSVCNMDSSFDKSSQSQMPLKTNKNSMSFEGTQGGQPNLRTASDPYKQTIATNGKQLAFSAADTIYSPRSVDLEVNFPSIKPVIRDWPLVPITVLTKTAAIPEHEYIWQGDLEVQRSRNLLEMHSGIQAHLSTLASPKVLEVVNKFPGKVLLNEVPRLSTWPAQFQNIGAKEDHIALFFFAKDIESYEKNYKPLVDNMIKKDLALKGNLGGVELLIFASNQLPHHCQRWNMLFFLWGVFRGRKESSSNPLKNPSLPPNSDVLPHHRDPNVSNQIHSPLKHMEKMPSARESSCSTSEAESKVGVVNNEDPNNKESSIGSEGNTKDSNLSPRFMSRSKQSCPKEENALKEDDAAGVSPIPLQATGTQRHRAPSDSEKTSSASSGGGPVKKVQPVEEQKMGVSTRVKEEEISGSKENSSSTAIYLEGQPGERENTSDRNVSCVQAGQRKRPFLDLTGPVMDDSSEVNDKVPLNDLNSESLREGSAKKKLKTYECRKTSGNECTSRKCDVGPSSSVEMRDHQSCEEKMIKKDPDAAERIVFPLDLNDGKEEIEMEEEDPIPLCRDGRLVPNLELALGADETTAKVGGGVLPLLAGRVIEHTVQDEMMNEEKQDDEAASLSLSLSFPFLDKEQTQRAVSSSDHERQKKVNTTPLFLFRDFTDKST